MGMRLVVLSEFSSFYAVRVCLRHIGSAGTSALKVRSSCLFKTCSTCKPHFNRREILLGLRFGLYQMC